MRTLIEDLRYAVRTLRANPGFTAIAVIALAIGIGANTAIFSVVNAILLRPLPYRDPQRLVLIQERVAKFIADYIPVSAPDVLDFQNRSRTLEAVGAFQNHDMNASGRSETLRVKAARITANSFPLLGVPASLGRTFTAAEDQPGRLVTVLSYGLWQRLFGGDVHAIGATLTLDGQSYQVVGVMPKSFVFPPPGLPNGDWPAELWIPMAFTKEQLSQVADNFNLSVIGRMKPGVTPQRASADVNAVAYFLSEKYKYGEAGAKLEARAALLPDLITGKTRTLLLLLLGSVAFVLLIACANVANLLLSRAASRRKEIAIRFALGATRLRMIRQLLTESVFLSLIGGALGIMLAWWGLAVLVTLIPASIPRTSEIDLDPTVLGFAAGISLLTGIVFGVFPALAASRGRSVSAGLNETGRGSTAGKQRNRLRSVLATAEMALALVLVAGAGLLIRSFSAVRNTDPGFRPEHALRIFVPLPATQYLSASAVRNFDRDLLAKLSALPGVLKAGAGSDMPLEGSDWNQIVFPEGIDPMSASKVPAAAHTVVMGDYFQTLGITLRQGRFLDDRDRAGAPDVVTINEALAREFWPHQNAIGKRLKYGGYGDKIPWREVVGVIGDAKTDSIEKNARLQFYEPFAQTNEGSIAPVGRNLNFVARTAGDPASVVAAVRMAVRSLDRSLPISELRTMDEVVDRSTAPRRFNTYLMGLFAGIALMLAAVGIYGVMAYSVTMKTPEIGIRMALGAARKDVLRMVLAQAFTIAGAGIAIGLAGALALTRLMSGLLYEVKPSDPLTFFGVSIFLAAVAVIATCVPALRAMRVDPTVALRYE